jgi:hypothetical protein
MNITIYNKTYLFGGFFIGSIGGYLDDEKLIPFYLSLTITIIGIILMLLSFKKPKQDKNLV